MPENKGIRGRTKLFVYLDEAAFCKERKPLGHEEIKALLRKGEEDVRKCRVQFSPPPSSIVFRR